tara:strand:- start:62 stop:232 length:171 start_codon:yes stop_codon:yes gene_type:complete
MAKTKEQENAAEVLSLPNQNSQSTAAPGDYWRSVAQQISLVVRPRACSTVCLEPDG